MMLQNCSDRIGSGVLTGACINPNSSFFVQKKYSVIMTPGPSAHGQLERVDRLFWHYHTEFLPLTQEMSNGKASILQSYLYDNPGVCSIKGRSPTVTASPALYVFYGLLSFRFLFNTIMRWHLD